MIIPNINGKIKLMFQTTNQPIIWILWHTLTIWSKVFGGSLVIGNFNPSPTGRADPRSAETPTFAEKRHSLVATWGSMVLLQSVGSQLQQEEWWVHGIFMGLSGDIHGYATEFLEPTSWFITVYNYKISVGFLVRVVIANPRVCSLI